MGPYELYSYDWVKIMFKYLRSNHFGYGVSKDNVIDILLAELKGGRNTETAYERQKGSF